MNQQTISRRAFWRGQLLPTTKARELSPPWADEARFNSTCTQCDACIEQCPQHVLEKSPQGFPVFNPHLGACDFCGVCVDVCAPKALNKTSITGEAAQRPWTLIVTVTKQNCLSEQGTLCRICGDTCDENALQFRPSLGGKTSLLLDTQVCTGCGGCISSCPTGALKLQNH